MTYEFARGLFTGLIICTEIAVVTIAILLIIKIARKK